MNRKNIRISSLLVCAMLLVAVFLAACTTDAASGSVQPSASGSSPKEPVALNVTSYRVEDEAVFKKLIEKFEEKYDYITVNLDLQADATAYITNLKADFLSGGNLDVFDVHPSFKEYGAFVSEGFCMDLSEENFVQNYREGFKDLTTIDGKVYGFAYNANFLCAIYNKDLYAKHGVEVPKSFNDFKEGIQTLQKNGLGGIVIPFETGWIVASLMYQQMTSEGTKAFYAKLDSGEMKDVRESEDFMKVLESLSQYKELIYPDSASIQYPQVLSLFAQGKAPAIMMGTWTFGTKAMDYPDINQGIYALPSVDNVDVAHLDPGCITCVYSGSKNPEEAKLWLDFFSSPENASIYSNGTKMIPTVKGVEMTFEGADVLQAQLDKGFAVTPIIQFENYDFWGKQWEALMVNILMKGNPVDKEVDAFNEFLQSGNF